MRQLVMAAVAAVAFAVPASAEPLIKTCSSDDYTVVYLVLAGRELAQVCTDEDPRHYLPDIYCDFCPPK